MHLGPVVEAGAAHDDVGDAGGAQRRLDRARLGVDPVEHRDLVAAGAAGPLGLHRAGDALAPRRARPAPPAAPAASPGPASVQSFFSRRTRGPGDDGVGGVEDVAGGAVVLLQLHDPAAGEVLVEVEDVAHVGAAPAVDGLVVVAHHADVPALARQSRRSSRYCTGLVSWNSSTSTWRKRPAQRARSSSSSSSSRSRAEQQVAEVDRAGPGQRRLVASRRPRGAARPPTSWSAKLHRGRASGLVLPAVDAREHLARREAGRPRRDAPRRGAASRAAAGRRRRRWRRTAAARPAPPRAAGSGPRRRGRSGPRASAASSPSRSASRSRISPAALLVKVTARTCQGASPAPRHQAGDAVDDDPGLAGAGAGQHQQRPVAVQDRLALGVVQRVEDGIDGRHGGPYATRTRPGARPRPAG